ncbi:MAG: radical SAM protein [Desulfobacterales bacterium]
MKILIVAINQEKFPSAVAPIGAASIVSILQKFSHEVSFLDLCFSSNISRNLIKELKKTNPEIVGLSIRNLDNCSLVAKKTFYKIARTIIRTVKAHSNAEVIMGGGGVTVLPRELAEYLDVSYAFIGEGEESLPAFLNSYETGKDFGKIPGLLYRNHNTWRLNPPDFSGKLDDYPLYSYDRIDYKKYFDYGGFIGYQTKRGCPFKCIYCSYRTLEGPRLRLRSPRLCVDDMEQIVRETGLRDFFFTDGVFNWPVDHAVRICEEIIKRDLKIRWIAYCNPPGLDHEVIRTFKASGCVGIELGVDAVTDKMLINMGKGFTRQDIQKAYRAFIDEELPLAVFLLFGGPDETYEDMVESQKSLMEFGKANAVFASLGIRIYPDAPIYNIALQEGVITDRTNLLEPVFYISEKLGEGAMERLDTLARREATWSTPTDWNSITVKSVQRILNRFRSIPNWKDIEAYGAHMRRKRC